MMLRYLWFPVSAFLVASLWVLFSGTQPPSFEHAVPSYQSNTKIHHATTAIPPIFFEDVSARWNLWSEHRQSSSTLTSIQETLSSGACIIDVNSDDWMDVLVLGGGGFTRDYGKRAWWHDTIGNRLLSNHQGRYLSGGNDNHGIDSQFAASSCAVADLDNDTFPDIVLTGINGVRLYRNNGRGQFELMQLPPGLNANGWVTHAAIADFNQDGRADIYLSRFVDYSKGGRTFEPQSGYKSVTDIDFQPEFYDALSNTLLINQGRFHFSAHPFTDDINDAVGRTLSSQWHDFNHDGWPDLMVLNGFGSPAQIYINNQGRSFSVAEQQLRKLHITESRSVLIDFFSDAATPSFLFSRPRSQRSISLSYVTDELQDTTYVTGFDKPSFHYDSWGMTAGDWDNNGYLDVYIANGGALPDEDAPNVTQAQSDLIYFNHNNTGLTHLEAAAMALPPLSGRAAIQVDLDNDGSLELLIANNNGRFQLIQNTQAGGKNWLGLIPDTPLDWIDATVVLELETRTIRRRYSGQGTLFGMADPRLHIGLGDAQTIKSLKIERHGQIFHVDALRLNHYHRVRLSDGRAETISPQRDNDPLAYLIASSEQDSLAILGSILTRNDQLSTYYMDLIWQQANTATRLTLLRGLPSTKNAQVTTALYRALESGNKDMLMLAITHLKALELESSIARVIPFLGSEDPDIVCNVADMLAFFYEQEEAVIHRKSLAVVPLIKTLSPATPAEAQICSLRALAEAENQRAVPHLLSQLTQPQDEEVRVQTIRALGLIRSSLAANRLIEMLPEMTSGRLIAATLIALKRLDHPAIASLVDTYIPHDYASDNDHQYLRYQLELFGYLFSEDDGLVMAKHAIKTRFNNLASAIWLSADEALTLRLIDIVAVSHDHSLLPSLAGSSPDRSEAIRFKRTGVTLNLASASQRKVLEQEIMRWRPEERQKLVALFPQSLTMSKAMLISLAKEWSQNAADRLFDHIALLRPEYQGLTIAAIFEQQQIAASPAFLNRMTNSHILFSDAMAPVLQSTPADSHPALLRWVYSAPVAHLSHQTQMKIKVLFNHYMSRDDLSWQQKRAMLATAASADAGIAEQFIPLYADALNDKEILDMLSALPVNHASASLNALKSKAFNDPANSRYVRLKAALLMALPDQQLAALVGDST